MTTMLAESVLYLLMTLCLTSMTSSCTVNHNVEPSVRHVDSESGSDVLNMSVYVQESAVVRLSGRQSRVSFHRHFPRTESIHIDVETMKITRHDGVSIPWISLPSGHDQLSAVQVLLEPSSDEITLGFEYSAYIKSESRVDEDCQRFFHMLFYPVHNSECQDSSFSFGLATSGLSDKCVASFRTPESHVNITPVYTEQSLQPKLYQISLKCFGGDTCTCACQGDITDFCRKHLTDTKVLSLLPWPEAPFALMMGPFFVSVMIRIVHLVFLEKAPVGWYLDKAFNMCLIVSVSAVFFFSLIIPVHMDATTRSCSTVFESQGGYFFPLLFWTYFPYVITLLIATGFIDSVDLVVAWNGNLKMFFVLYQLLSPLAQIWLFLYVYVIPISDALLLSATVLSLSCLRIYLRNPFVRAHQD